LKKTLPFTLNTAVFLQFIFHLMALDSLMKLLKRTLLTMHFRDKNDTL